MKNVLWLAVLWLGGCAAASPTAERPKKKQIAPTAERPKKKQIAPPVVEVVEPQRWIEADPLLWLASQEEEPDPGPSVIVMRSTTTSACRGKYPREITHPMVIRLLEHGEKALREGRGSVAADMAVHAQAIGKILGVKDRALLTRAEELQRQSRRVLGARLHELPAKR